VEERKLSPLRYYANCVSTTLTVLILDKVESVYFFYGNPVYFGAYGQDPETVFSVCENSGE